MHKRWRPLEPEAHDLRGYYVAISILEPHHKSSEGTSGPSVDNRIDCVILKTDIVMFFTVFSMYRLVMRLCAAPTTIKASQKTLKGNDSGYSVTINGPFTDHYLYSIKPRTGRRSHIQQDQKHNHQYSVPRLNRGGF